MPWTVERDDRCPAVRPWAVVQSDGTLIACHSDRDHAVNQQKALYANEPKRSEPMTKYTDRAVPVRAEMELRSLASGGSRFVGYAAVFNSESEPMPFIETIDPVAFNRTLGSKTNHTFVMNHADEMLLASRASGHLNLTADSKGLLTEADLPNTSYANDLRALYDAGEVWGMSFTFRAARNGETWSQGGMRRHLTDVSLGHVTALTGLQPAYPGTSGTVQIRSLAAQTNANVDDIDNLLDAIREGRALSEDERRLLLQITVVLCPSDVPDDGADAEPDPTDSNEPMMEMDALTPRAVDRLRDRLVAIGAIAPTSPEPGPDTATAQ